MMQGVNKEMNDIGLNILLQHKVRKYYEFQHNQGNEDRQNKLSLIDILPAQIKEEVLLDVNVNFISQISFIHSLSQECKKEISLSIKQKVIYPDDIVFKEKESNNCLYFISQGSIDLTITVKTKNEQNNQTVSEMSIEHLKKQDVFGFEGFIENQQNPYNAKAKEYTVLQYIDREQLLILLQNFPVDYERFCYIRDEVVLTNKYRLVNRKCLSCGELIHTFNDCPRINPVIKQKNIQKEKNIVNERQKSIRKRVCLFKALRDQIEIAKSAITVIAKNDEESILSDLCSVLVDEEGKEEDDSNEDSQDEEDDEYEDDDNEITSLKKYKRASVFQEQQSSDVFNEEEEEEFEREKQKQIERKSRVHREASLTDLQNLFQQISQEQNNQRVNANNANNNLTQLQNQSQKFRRFRQQDQQIAIEEKYQNHELDIIDENEEDATQNMMTSQSVWPSPAKKPQNTMMLEVLRGNSHKLNTILEINQNQDNESLENSSNFSFDSHAIQQKVESNENEKNIFNQTPNSPLQTFDKIKLEMSKQLSNKLANIPIMHQSQNSNNIFSQSTLKVLETDANNNNNINFKINCNNFTTEMDQQSPKNKIQEQYQNPQQINSGNQKINGLLDHQDSDDDQEEIESNQEQHINFSTEVQNYLLKNNNRNQFINNNQILKKNQNIIKNQNQTQILNLTNNTYIKTETSPNNISNLTKYSHHNNNLNISSYQTPSNKTQVHRNKTTTPRNKLQTPRTNKKTPRNKGLTPKNLNFNQAFSAAINNMSNTEDQFNTSEDNHDEFNFSQNRAKFQEYDIYEKIQMRRKKKAQLTYIEQEKAITKQYTQKVADHSSTEDILNHIARTTQRRQTKKKSQVQISFKEMPTLNLQQQYSSQQSPKKSNLQGIQAPVQAISLARKTSKKLTKNNLQAYQAHQDQIQEGIRSSKKLGQAKGSNMVIQKNNESFSSPRRNAKITTRIPPNKQTNHNQSSFLERKGTIGTLNSSVVGNQQLFLNNSYQVEQQNAVQVAGFEGHPESSEYMIRCLSNLQTLDLLIVRKHYQLQQQKEDNEMDIDIAKDFKQYYPKQNLKEIIKKYRKYQTKQIKASFHQLKAPLNSSKLKKMKDPKNQKTSQVFKSNFAPPTVKQSIQLTNV